MTVSPPNSNGEVTISWDWPRSGCQKVQIYRAAVELSSACEPKYFPFKEPVESSKSRFTPTDTEKIYMFKLSFLAEDGGQLYSEEDNEPYCFGKRMPIRYSFKKVPRGESWLLRIDAPEKISKERVWLMREGKIIRLPANIGTGSEFIVPSGPIEIRLFADKYVTKKYNIEDATDE